MNPTPVLLESFAYSREAVNAGEWWRIPASAFAHLSAGHLAANLAAAALLVAMMRALVPIRLALGVLAVGAAGVGAGIHWATTLGWYAGLSGALYALIAFGTLALVRRDGRMGAACLGLCLIQILADQTRSLSWLGEPLAPQAHAWGFLTGAVLALALLLRRPVQPSFRSRSA